MNNDASASASPAPSSFQIPQPMGRCLYFTKQVDQASIADISQKIMEVNEADRFLEKVYPVIGQQYNPAPIKIIIDSYGGYVYQCFGLISIMNVSLTPIHTYVTGTAMSAGFMIAIHGHRRYCYENSTLMYHQVSGGTIGNVKNMEESVIESKRLQTMIERMTLSKTRIPVSTIEEIYKTKQNLYLDAEEAMKLGCVDEIIYAARLPSARVESSEQTEEQAHPHPTPAPSIKKPRRR